MDEICAEYEKARGNAKKLQQAVKKEGELSVDEKKYLLPSRCGQP
jgi:hypothetical protein